MDDGGSPWDRPEACERAGLSRKRSPSEGGRRQSRYSPNDGNRDGSTVKDTTRHSRSSTPPSLAPPTPWQLIYECSTALESRPPLLTATRPVRAKRAAVLRYPCCTSGSAPDIGGGPASTFLWSTVSTSFVVESAASARDECVLFGHTTTLLACIVPASHHGRSSTPLYPRRDRHSTGG